MAEPFLSEIRIMSFNFAPKGWSMCNGQLMPINQNQALFSLLGTTFGGNGQTTFALPDMRGNVPIHVGSGHTLGEKGGQQSTTLTISQLPTHIHFMNATSNTGVANTLPSSTTMLANASGDFIYNDPSSNLVTLDPRAVSNIGGSQPHNNMQPYLTLTFCIALQGIFPSQN
jgi:microcystin-dependent protein